MQKTSFIIYDRKTDAPLMSWPAKSNHVRDMRNAENGARKTAADANAKMGCDVCYVRAVTVDVKLPSAEAFHNQHVRRYAGRTITREGEVYAMEYGALRSVYADKACNYSHREFWV